MIIRSTGAITGISSLTATNLTGTLQTAAQPIITSVGTLSNLSLNMAGTGVDTPALRFSGVNFDQTMYLSITQGSGAASKAVVLNSTLDHSGIGDLAITRSFIASTSVSTPTVVCDTISKVGTQIMTATVLNINPTTLQLRGTIISTSAIELNYLSTISPGTVGNGKAMVVDGFGSIAGLNSISAVSLSTSGNITVGGVINGFLAYANQSAIQSLGLLTEYNIGASNPLDAYITIVGSGLSYTDSGFTSCIRMTGPNATPVIGNILISNGSSANAMWIGTHTNNVIFGTNSSTKMVLTAAGRLGIGVGSPSCPLDVSGSVSSTIDSAGSGVAYFTRSSGLVSTIGPLSSINISIKASNAFLAGSGFYTTSDVRRKKDFAELSDDVADAMLSVSPVLYRYKTQTDSTPLQLGYRAQDLIKGRLTHVINFTDVNDLPIEDPEVDTANVQYSVDYSKVVCLLHKLVLRQQFQIDELKNMLKLFLI
ncbi:hypothetical protein Pcac1_g14815 [Phytophthora cactorum]|uniref:Peptidase S74 domain-containing protein n=3 Tax=Phytophthora cactorum TaxID=29920 RepID=A0A329SMY1_9STRA|nr:hypothetical protein Pcac1_g14815 [Phytophthora cactorum]KAG2804619.1 hypothetical protein PC111_g18178 [Phytophthora cactorum]KAG3033490.1 hypothetical protein PC119_g5293 [Phytophthora cactorum]KAG3086109.1 hypothetical protein PC122_g9357 [Phytophthora cactorum]KAG3087157.1 hypothetical protein PC121_g4688 [Phytophthora cactorum]